MSEMFSPIEPFRTWFLDTGDGHSVYIEQSGNPDGKPVVFLHGGPGGGTNPRQRQLFDPEAYHIILFDQRGCGLSTPSASVENNTTWHLVDDIERIRESLDIDEWQVFGGSWGSTLALAYAETHPERVSELVLRGIFMLRPYELNWFYQEGASNIFPDVWEQYLEPIPVDERHDLMAAYHRRLFGTDEAEQLRAARAWSTWEWATSALIPEVEGGSDERCLAFARIENHYFVNDGFFVKPDQLLADAGKLANIPTVIIHGRYDVICPVRNAWELKKAMPHAQLYIIPDAGHSMAEPGITAALVGATNRFATAARN